MALGATPRLGPSARWSALWGFGMVLVFVGERLIGAGAGTSRGVATIGGILLVVVAMLARLRRASQAAATHSAGQSAASAVASLGDECSRGRPPRSVGTSDCTR